MAAGDLFNDSKAENVLYRHGSHSNGDVKHVQVPVKVLTMKRNNDAGTNAEKFICTVGTGDDGNRTASTNVYSTDESPLGRADFGFPSDKAIVIEENKAGNAS